MDMIVNDTTNFGNNSNQTFGFNGTFPWESDGFDFESKSPFKYVHVRVIYAVVYAAVFLGCITGKSEFLIMYIVINVYFEISSTVLYKFLSCRCPYMIFVNYS